MWSLHFLSAPLQLLEHVASTRILSTYGLDLFCFLGFRPLRLVPKEAFSFPVSCTFGACKPSLFFKCDL